MMTTGSEMTTTTTSHSITLFQKRAPRKIIVCSHENGSFDERERGPQREEEVEAALASSRLPLGRACKKKGERKGG